MVMTAAVMWLLYTAIPVFAMDAMTADELEALSGRTGLSISFGSTFTTKASFDHIAIGDQDGTGQASGAGWLVLSGRRDFRADLWVEIPCGTEASVNVAENCSGDIWHPPSDANGSYGLIAIPDGKEFCTFSLTETNIGLDVPGTVSISLMDINDNTQTYKNNVENNEAGQLTVENLRIDKAPTEYQPAGYTAPGKSTLYIWAHD